MEKYIVSISWFKPGVGKLRPVGHIGPTTCLCRTSVLRMLSTFLNTRWEKKQKKRKECLTTCEIICNSQRPQYYGPTASVFIHGLPKVPLVLHPQSWEVEAKTMHMKPNIFTTGSFTGKVCCPWPIPNVSVGEEGPYTLQRQCAAQKLQSGAENLVWIQVVPLTCASESAYVKQGY